MDSIKKLAYKRFCNSNKKYNSSYYNNTIYQLLLFQLKLQIDGGYRVRQFLSSNGKKIYAVLYSNQQNIQRFAQQLQFNHLLTPEFTDILSFEPVDSRFRLKVIYLISFQTIKSKLTFSKRNQR
eukprot:TRINITY_DN15765_c0_g1_i1.p4 TRINITY_DN15765_c0_g1~~TRINITY_DN15765_c0_g1_i1.p4  ORF type:complete len:124 (+),score=8.47 TRINITY_DN15765_c0_g1_i1:459-830(+)